MTSDQTQQLIRAVEQADSPESLSQAVWALAAARQEAAIPTFIRVLGYNNPGAAVAAVEGLVKLGEAAVPSLLEQIDGYDYGARAWSIRALSQIGDPRALDILTGAAESDFALSVRRTAAKGLGSISWSQLPAEEVSAAQAKALETLLQVCQDSEWIVRYAAVVGLQALAATQLDYKQRVQVHFQQLDKSEPDLTVRARAQMASVQLQQMPVLN